MSKHGVGLDGIKNGKVSERASESIKESTSESIKEEVTENHTDNYPDIGVGQIILAPYGYGFTDIDDGSDSPF